MAKANRTNVEPAEVVEISSTTPELKTATVNCEMLNVRKKASLDGEVITVINEGDEVTIASEKENSAWVKVTLTTGQTGFCMKEFLR